MLRIGFIGLGKMGRHMAENMYSHGAEIKVFDAIPKVLEDVHANGIPVASSSAEIGNWADLIFLSLPNANVIDSVLFGTNGVISENTAKNMTVIDLGTTAYIKTLEFAKRLNKLGFGYADAPVSGMESRAKSGELTLMYGGTKDIFDKAYPYFEMISNKILNFGNLGSGQMAKLVNQLLFDINAAALGEILALAGELGLDPQKTVELVNSGTGRSWASEFFAPKIIEGNFSEGYAMGNAYKDIVSANEISAQLQLPMPILAAATAIYQMALKMGTSNEGKGAMIKVYEKIYGVNFRKK